jgi:hypothetical protein
MAAEISMGLWKLPTKKQMGEILGKVEKMNITKILSTMAMRMVTTGIVGQ